MAQRDASKVQLDFPQLTADIIAALQLTGTLGLFNMSDVVIPTISVGNVRPQTFELSPIVFTSSQIVHGSQFSPAANTVIADTGPLAAGTYDIKASMSLNATISLTSTSYNLQHRNAANAATLATLLSIAPSAGRDEGQAILPIMGYVIALNERLRLITGTAGLVNVVSGEIFAAIRPTP